ncbi:MAG: RluA family pseudouridine synthase [Myxococcales bacterium]|nr:RluA family pseudouridine synthase [Myxococcales bacterium]
MSNTPSLLSLTLEQEQRVDQACRLLLPHLSRRSLKTWLQQHPPLLDGTPVKPGILASVGSLVEVLDPGDFSSVTTSASHESPPQEQPSILFLDQDIIALDKPQGWPSHPLHPWETQTASQWLLLRHPELAEAGGEARAPGLLHRLDNTTSGLLLFARHPQSYAFLLERRDQQDWKKFYLAWVVGRVEQPFEQSLAIYHASSKKMACAPSQPSPTTPTNTNRRSSRLEQDEPHTPQTKQQAQRACSRIWPLFYDETSHASLVCVQIETGVRHQIRVHLSFSGFPIIGDVLYGGPKAERVSLHSWATFLPKREDLLDHYALFSPWESFIFSQLSSSSTKQSIFSFFQKMTQQKHFDMFLALLRAWDSVSL